MHTRGKVNEELLVFGLHGSLGYITMIGRLSTEIKRGPAIIISDAEQRSVSTGLGLAGMGTSRREGLILQRQVPVLRLQSPSWDARLKMPRWGSCSACWTEDCRLVPLRCI